MSVMTSSAAVNLASSECRNYSSTIQISSDDDYDEIKRSLLLLSDRHAQGCSKPLAGGSSPSQLPGSPLQGRTTPMQTRVGGKAFAMRPADVVVIVIILTLWGGPPLRLRTLLHHESCHLHLREAQ